MNKICPICDKPIKPGDSASYPIEYNYKALHLNCYVKPNRPDRPGEPKSEQDNQELLPEE